MKNALVVRYDGSPFAVKMTKVLSVLVDSGFTCDVAVPSGHLSSVNVGAELGRDMRLETNIVELPCGDTSRLYWSFIRSFGLPELWNPVFERALAEQIARRRYDLVVVKDSKSLPTVFRAMARAGYDVPIVCDMYENAVMQLKDKWYRFGSPRMRARYALSGIGCRVARIERRFLPLCERIFVVVEEMRDYLTARYNLPIEKIEVVHNVEWLGPFDKITSNITQRDRPLISYVGGIAAHRGVSDFLKAVSLAHAYSKVAFDAVIVGARDSQKRAIESEMRALGISNIVTVIDYVSHVEAMRWIKKSFLGVVPHSDTPFVRTTVPNKLFQYMAAGVPLIVNDIPPLNRIVNETRSGWVANTAKPEAFSEAIVAALMDQAQAGERGRQGRAWCEKKYSWELESGAYSGCFETIASGN